MKIIVTGASGFVGQPLVSELVARGHVVVPLSFSRFLTGSADVLDVLGLRSEVCVHLAARVHVMKDSVANPLAEYRRINVTGTLDLARRAVDAGVRRFIFVSSIKVNGEMTPPGSRFSADDQPAPRDAYGISKLEAEESLAALAKETGLEVVIVRPPLVYGPGVKGNFATMIRWLRLGAPLPFGAIQNLRSFVGVDNLIDLLAICVVHPAACAEKFLVSDGEDVSSADLLLRLGNAMGRPARLVSLPVPWLKAVASLIGRRDMAMRLCENLQVDMEKTQRILNWRPPITLDQGLRQVV